MISSRGLSARLPLSRPTQACRLGSGVPGLQPAAGAHPKSPDCPTRRLSWVRTSPILPRVTITTFTGGSVETNGYLLETDDAVLVIDAPEGIADRLRDRQLKPSALLLTHQHFDHVEHAREIARMGAPIHAWSPYSHDLILDEEAQRWGLPITIEPFEVDHTLDGQANLEIAGLRFELLHVPGHSPDSVVFSLPDSGLAFTGDTVFAGSIGRPDLPGGDYSLLINGIHEKLLSLPGATRLLPGHGPETTPAEETATNPYFTQFSNKIEL